MILKAFGGLLAICSGLSAAGGTVYTVAVEPGTGRLIRVPAVRSTKTITPRTVSGKVVLAKEVKPVDPAAGTPPAAGSVDDLIRNVSYRYGIAPSFVHAVIRAESNYNQGAISNKGAVGLMQLMPDTASRFGVRNRFDPAQNVEGGVRYLRHLMDLYPGQTHMVVAAYNAGEAAVDRYQGIPPYRETRQFVPRVVRHYQRLRLLDQPAGFEAAPKKLEGPRIFQVQEASGAVRYTTESQ